MSTQMTPRRRFAAISVVFLIGCGRVQTLDDPPVAVRAEPVRSEPIELAIAFSGTVKERRKLELSFKVPGTVDRLLKIETSDGKKRDVQAGDRVQKDAVIARLDEVDYRRERESARARLESARAKSTAARADASFAAKDRDRYEELLKNKAVTKEEVDRARAKAEAADAEALAAASGIAAAELAVSKAEQDLKDCSLVVPMDQSTVVARYVEEGERIAAGKSAFLLMDLSKLVVGFGVSDSLVGRLRIGQEFKTTSDAFPGESFPARLTKISPNADDRTRTFEVEVTIDDPKGLKPGMIASVNIGRHEDAILLPLTAIRRAADADRYAVFVVVSEGEAEVARMRRVELDGLIDNRARIKQGKGSEIKLGDRVIVAGANRLLEGDRVRTLDATIAGEQTIENLSKKANRIDPRGDATRGLDGGNGSKSRGLKAKDSPANGSKAKDASRRAGESEGAGV